MIVGMPQIASTTPPVKPAIPNSGSTGQFSAALSEASQNAQAATTQPKIMSRPSGGGRSSTRAKDTPKSSATPTSSSAPATAAASPASPTADSPVKILNTLSFVSVLPATSDLVDSDSDSGVSSGATATTPKPDAITATALSAVQASTNASATGLGPITPELLHAPPSVPPQELDAKTGIPSAPTSSEIQKPELERSKTPSPKTANDSQELDLQSLKNVLANACSAPVPKKNPAEPRAVSHETAQTGSATEAKTSMASTSQNHRVALNDPTSASAPALPPIQSVSVKPPAATQAPPSVPDAGAKTNADSVQSSAGTLKKDADQSQNSASQSQKHDSPAALGSANKQGSADSHAPTTLSVSNASASTQISQPVSDLKPVVASVAGKASDPVLKAPVQSSAVETDAISDVAASNLVSPIQVAKLVERAGQTELRVGIQAGEFGSVDIRTSMAHSQFTAEISVERGELGRALSAELPALHDRLAEQRVPPANIIVHDHSYGNSGSSDLRQGARQQQYAIPSQTIGANSADAIPAMIAMESNESSAGLDIHI